MDIQNLTLEQISNHIDSLKAQLEESCKDGYKPNPFELGKNYLIRTVTMTLSGKLERVFDNELLLSNAAWIADTGRFHNAVKEGSFDEIEPFVNNVVVGRGAIIDATIINFPLPKDQK